MDAVTGIALPVVSTAQAFPVPSSQSALLLPGSAGSDQQVAIDPQAADQAHYQTIQQLAQHIANVFVVSDTEFTIFKDNTGQYITRYTSLRDGKVTYIPQPTLFKLGGDSSNPAPSVVNIRA